VPDQGSSTARRVGLRRRRAIVVIRRRRAALMRPVLVIGTMSTLWKPLNGTNTVFTRGAFPAPRAIVAATPLWAAGACGEDWVVTSPLVPPRAPTRPTRRWRSRATSAALLAAMLYVLVLRENEATFPRTALFVLAVGSWLPLLLRHRLPAVSLGGAVLAEAVHLAVLDVGSGLSATQSMAAYQPVPIATMVGAFAYARSAPPRRGWTAGLTAGTVLATVAVLLQPLELLATDIVIFNLVAIAAAVGVAASARRERAARAARDRQEEVQREVQRERVRIARELHDVLAHHLTLVNAQAGVAEYLLRTDTDAAESALRGITQHTRQALDEVRATVGLLRQTGDADIASQTTVGDAPLPSIAQIEALVGAACATGQDAELDVEGVARPVDAAVDLAGYRIVQEALTNAARHASGAAVRVRVRWTATSVELTVDNDPAVGVVTSRLGGGHGLLGMRERAAAASGTVDVGAREDGGFRVRAVLPAVSDDVPAHFTA
jgi:signal transduction histidine kinase